MPAVILHVALPDLVRGQRLVHHLLRLADDGVEVRLVLEALRVDLVDVLGAGGPRREPAAGGDDLQAADRRRCCRVRGSAWR